MPIQEHPMRCLHNSIIVESTTVYCTKQKERAKVSILVRGYNFYWIQIPKMDIKQVVLFSLVNLLFMPSTSPTPRQPVDPTPCRLPPTFSQFHTLRASTAILSIIVK